MARKRFTVTQFLTSLPFRHDTPDPIVTDTDDVVEALLVILDAVDAGDKVTLRARRARPNAEA